MNLLIGNYLKSVVLDEIKEGKFWSSFVDEKTENAKNLLRIWRKVVLENNLDVRYGLFCDGVAVMLGKKLFFRRK